MRKIIDIILQARNNTATGIQGAEKSVGGLNARLRKFGGAIKANFMAVAAGAAAAVRMMVRVGMTAHAEYKKLEQANAKLRGTLRATGYAAGFTSKELNKLSLELETMTGVAEEVTTSVMSILATFKGVKGDNFKRATRAILDMGAAMGKAGRGSADIESSVIQVGKALNDPIAGMSALARVGVQFTDVQKAQITRLQQSNNLFAAQGIILQELEAQFGGTAAAMHKVGGGFTAMQHAFGGMMEELGYGVDVVFDKRAKGLAGIFDSIKEAIRIPNMGKLQEEADEYIRKMEADKTAARQAEADKRAEITKAQAKTDYNTLLNLFGDEKLILKDGYAAFVNNLNAMQKRSEEFHAKRKDQAEETADKIAELEDEIADHHKRKEQARLQDMRDEVRERADAMQEVARMTVQEIIDQAKADKQDQGVEDSERERAEKLRAKEARGIRISKRDAAFLAAFEEREVNRQNIPGAAGEMKHIEEQIEALRTNNRTLSDIKTELHNMNEHYKSLLVMG